MDHLFTYFSFLTTLRLGNLRIDVLDVVIDGVPIMFLLSMVPEFVACHLLCIIVDFILLFNIYCFLF